jgi:hypothetical protein
MKYGHSTEQQLVEATATITAETDNLTIEHRVPCGNAVRDFFREQIELAEGHATPRNEFAVVAADVRERAEAIMFSSKTQSG